MGFWKERFADIRGNLLWQIITWTLGGGMLTATAALVQFIRHEPPTWKIEAVIFIVCTLGLAVVFLLASRNRYSPREFASRPNMSSTETQVSVNAHPLSPDELEKDKRERKELQDLDDEIYRLRRLPGLHPQIEDIKWRAATLRDRIKERKYGPS